MPHYEVTLLHTFSQNLFLVKQRSWNPTGTLPACLPLGDLRKVTNGNEPSLLRAVSCILILLCGRWCISRSLLAPNNISHTSNPGHKKTFGLFYIPWIYEAARCVFSGLKVVSNGRLPAFHGELHPAANLFSAGVLKAAVPGKCASICGQMGKFEIPASWNYSKPCQLTDRHNKKPHTIPRQENGGLKITYIFSLRSNWNWVR